MNVDNALANFIFLWIVGSGDTGMRGVEHRSILQVRGANKVSYEVYHDDEVSGGPFVRIK